jgi:UDP-N-acetylglucosamine 4,6-dehydratase
MVAGNILAGKRCVRFAVVRYGNVLGSRGSIIPFFKEQIKNGYLPITDINMTRFWLTIDEGVQFVLDSLSRMHGGEIFVPKIPSFKVVDVATVISPDTPIKIIGIRPGEKLHEVMITEDDSEYTLEFKHYYVILAPFLINSSEYNSIGTKVPKGFSFTSQNNKLWYNFDTFKIALQNAGLLN